MYSRCGGTGIQPRCVAPPVNQGPAPSTGRPREASCLQHRTGMLDPDRKGLVFTGTQACNYLAASPHGLNHSCHTHIVPIMSMWILWFHSAVCNYVCVRMGGNRLPLWESLWALTLRPMDTVILSTRSASSFFNLGSWSLLLSNTAS